MSSALATRLLAIAAASSLLLPVRTGAETADVATADRLYSQVRELHSLARYSEAIPLAKRVLTIREKALGPEHPDTAASVNTLAVLYRATGAYRDAEPLYKRALAIREKTLGADHPDTAASLNNLALLYQATGAYAQAEPLHKRAMAIVEKALGPDHPQTATALNNLAELHRITGAYTEAEPLYSRALAIFEKAVGPEHPHTAHSLNNLALLYETTGAYAKAEPLYSRALAIFEKAAGPDHPRTAMSLHNLAALYLATGAYGRAEPLYRRALKILVTALGPEHPLTTKAIGSLAAFYFATGAYGRAEPLLKGIVATEEKTLGAEHPATAESLNNLATVYRATGAYAQAEPLYSRALAILEKALGPDHPRTATTLNNLAALYEATNAYRDAEPLYKRALAIREKTLGADHPDTAASLNNLAELYRITGAYTEAEQLYLRALAIFEKALGPDHPSTALILANLGSLSWAQGRWSDSAARIQRSVTIGESNVRRVLPLGDESRKRAYTAMLTGATEAAVSFSIDALGKVPYVPRLGFEVVLQRKGLVQDTMADAFAAARASLSQSDRQVFKRWTVINAQIATLMFRGPETMPAETFRELLARLRAEAAALERHLSQRSAEFRAQVEPVTVERVQRIVPSGAVLVEWFRYHRFSPTAKGNERRWGEPRYVAYVLKREGRPVAVDVGDAKPIETTLSDLLAALRDRGTIVAALARELDARLLQPLRSHLADAEQLLFSPDGMLNLLPFGVLRDERGRYLIQQKELTYLTTGRDLLRLANAMPRRDGPIVLANPDFGPLVGPATASASDNRRSADLSPGVLTFTPLRGTAAEAHALKVALRLNDDQVLTLGKATEAALKNVKGPRILHLATHGFFLTDRATDPDDMSKQLQSRDRLRALKGENPMLRSGLALAGANQLRSGNDDGILTALEVSGLDLVGTELAVLSACDTGLGEVNTGEGVYGLRRALVLAGARTQVTSLWKVDDAATKDLMIDYYTRLGAGAGRAEGLRAAQLAMLNDPRRAHPYYWAAFVVIGDRAPLAR